MAERNLGDYEVLVNGRRTGSPYANVNAAVEFAMRLHASNPPNVITVSRISTSTAVWLPPLNRDQRTRNARLRSRIMQAFAIWLPGHALPAIIRHGQPAGLALAAGRHDRNHSFGDRIS
jgi:hypothetical protein